jgi:hypothetical protein
MHETGPDNWLTEQELRTATGISRHSLVRLRQRGLFPKPTRVFGGRGTGSASYYPPVAVSMIRRFYELRRETRNIDECLWRLWLDGFPIDICKWADECLAPLQTALASVGNIEDLKKTIIERSSSTRPTRTDPRRAIYSRLRMKEDISLLQWGVDVMAGLAPAKSLHDPASPAFNALKMAGGLSEDAERPDYELLVEGFSLARLRDILAGAGTAEMEQSWRDWKFIAEMAEASEAVDWHATRKTLNLQRTSSAQPPAPADFLFALWRNFYARAVLLPFLISVRRSPDHSHKLSEILAVARWALAQLPGRTPDQGGAAAAENRPPAAAQIPLDAPAGTEERHQ